MPWAFSILPPIEIHLLQRRSQDFQRGNTLCQTEGTHQFSPPEYCFLKKRFTNGGLRVPQDPPPVATSLGNKENFEDKGAQETRFCHLRKFCGHSTSYNCSPSFS